MNATTLDDLTFRGADDDDVTTFFQSFLRFAVSGGHQRDDAWLLDHLETCLAGAALNYYVNQGDASEMDFKTARLALINRFDRSSGPPGPVTVAAAPPRGTPAVAPTAGLNLLGGLVLGQEHAVASTSHIVATGRPALPARTLNELEGDASLRTIHGRLKVTTITGEDLGYLHFYQPFRYWICTTIGEPISVEFLTGQSGTPLCGRLRHNTKWICMDDYYMKNRDATWEQPDFGPTVRDGCALGRWSWDPDTGELNPYWESDSIQWERLPLSVTKIVPPESYAYRSVSRGGEVMRLNFAAPGGTSWGIPAKLFFELAE